MSAMAPAEPSGRLSRRNFCAARRHRRRPAPFLRACTPPPASSGCRTSVQPGQGREEIGLCV